MTSLCRKAGDYKISKLHKLTLFRTLFWHIISNKLELQLKTSIFTSRVAARSWEGVSCWSCSQEPNCVFTVVGLVLKKTTVFLKKIFPFLKSNNFLNLKGGSL